MNQIIQVKGDFTKSVKAIVTLSSSLQEIPAQKVQQQRNKTQC